jgi:hypothetical protein
MKTALQKGLLEILQTILSQYNDRTQYFGFSRIRAIWLPRGQMALECVSWDHKAGLIQQGLVGNDVITFIES